jgi:GNAT superfamily N-acetyltransferase
MGMVNKITISPKFNIRRLRVADAASLADFYNSLSKESIRTFRPIGTKTDLEKCIEIAVDNGHKGGRTQKYDLIALYEAQVIAWAFIWNLLTDSPTFGLAVADAYHNMGIGKLLMSEIMGWARKQGLQEIHLTVVQDNTVALKLYKQQGFILTGEFTADNGQPFFRMVANLLPE